ncbi:MAG: lysylphosphatidylglycerol synthase domain-containing protein, partial [Acidimicrobiales bacterium]
MAVTTTDTSVDHRSPFVVCRRIRLQQAITISVVMVAIIVASAALAWDGTVADWEESILLSINGWPDQIEPLVWAVQQVGVLAAPLIAGLVIVAFTRQWRYLVPFALVLPLKLGIEKGLIKQLVERERPYVSVGDQIEVRGPALEGLSFPSGHTTTAFALGILVAAFIPNRWRIVPVVWAVGVAIARIYMGEHNVLDVVAGAALGTLFATLLWYFVLNRFVPAGEAEAASRAEAEAPHREHVRSPVDLVRLIAAGVLVVGGIVLANLLDSTLLGLSDDGATLLEELPDWVRDVPAAALAVTVMVSVGGALGWALFTTRFRRFAMLAGGLVLAATASVVVGELVFEMVDDAVRRSFDTDSAALRYRDSDGMVLPGDPLLAGAVAMLGVATSYLSRRILRWLGLGLAAYAAVSVWASGVPALGLLTDIGLGLLAASALLLIFGRHDLAPDEGEIEEALQSIGLPLTDLTHLDVDARGSAPWVGRTTSGDRVFVKALGRDERSADLLFRAYRWFRYSKTGDHRPFVSLRRAVEHEALVSLQAAALGVRTPRILGVAEAGVDGMVLAYEALDGRSADTIADISDDALVAIWSMVSELHSRRIAHRDLRLANIFVADDGEPWLIDFGFSELAASDQLLGTDVAELLASSTSVVGVERAVAAAHVATGLAELERALPWLQPAALSSATRRALGDDDLDDIRTMLIEQCGVPPEDPVRLERVEPKSAFILATIGLSAWFLVPQLADIDNIWEQVRSASAPWAALAIVLSSLTYVAATVALLGAIPVRLPFGPALSAQMASSFANRVTPARVGGLATNVRWFQRRGVPTAVSVTAVGVNAVAGLVMHLLLTLTFLLLSGGQEGSDGLAVPSPEVVAGAAIVTVVVLAVSTALPVSRRLLASHVLPQLRAGWVSIRTIGRNPARLTLLFGGSAAITLAYLGAMVASLEAFGSTASFPVVGLLFLTGSAVANAAPTPGGLGATEAALVAALGLVEESAIVIPAVFLYRFVTFWLPILPGWAAMTYLRRTD